VLDAAQLADPPFSQEALQQFIELCPRLAELRDYQQAALFTALRCRWGRIALATNAGKGAIIALLAAWAAAHKFSVLICCDEIAVYDALLGELREWADLAPALVRAGGKGLGPPGPGVTLAMIPTLARRLSPGSDGEREEEAKEWARWVGEQGMVICDEADKATAATWRLILDAAPSSLFRFGFSGTFPQSMSYEDWQLEELLGPVLFSAKNMEMVERGVSARPHVQLVGFDVTGVVGAPPTWDEWSGMSPPMRRLWVYEKAIMFNAMRHRFVASLIRPGTPTVIVINRIEHGTQLEMAIPGAVFVDGSASELARIKALEAFRRGEILTLIVTRILDRGTNRLGYAQDIIFASGEGSKRQTLQRVGRGLRRHEGKADLRIVDLVDRLEVDDADTSHTARRLRKLAGYLHEAGRTRVQLYQDEGFEVEVSR